MENTGTDAFAQTCREILDLYPEAIGVAYKGLDCGCSLMCGVSAQGQPLGALQHVPGTATESGAGALICLRCKQDNGLQRVVNQGVVWPGTEAEWPEMDLRIAIGTAVFGPGYVE